MIIKAVARKVRLNRFEKEVVDLVKSFYLNMARLEKDTIFRLLDAINIDHSNSLETPLDIKKKLHELGYSLNSILSSQKREKIVGLFYKGEYFAGYKISFDIENNEIMRSPYIREQYRSDFKTVEMV